MEIRPSAQQIIPPVVKNLLIINGLFYLAFVLMRNYMPFNPILVLGMFYVESPHFEIWQVATHMFMHAEGFSHILFNMFNLWMFGSLLERSLGSKRFLQYYILCGLGAAVCHQLVQYIEFHHLGGLLPNYPTIGASGAVFGLMFAFGYLFPNAMLYLYFAIPVKAKYVMIGLALIGLFAGFSKFEGDNIAHFAHLGGMLAGWVVFMIWRIRYNTGQQL